MVLGQPLKIWGKRLNVRRGLQRFGGGVSWNPYPFRTFRLMTSFCTSLVPSPIVQSLLSR